MNSASARATEMTRKIGIATAIRTGAPYAMETAGNVTDKAGAWLAKMRISTRTS